MICKLLPKRRVAEEVSGLEPEVVVPIQWHVTEFKTDPVQSSSEPSPNYYSSPYEDDDSVMVPANNNSEGEGSFEAFESPEHVLDIEHYPITERHIMHASEYLHDDHFMVLYNGNAEVIGNFRALNFYKASDINIKEDIKLLSQQDRNPRDILMKIDGVEYKFKEGVRGNNDSNRRFVGYIAQQIESVVPQAVQLIDGILHVDYESLIPYLSESIKQNFKDIDHLNSKTEQIHQVVDMLYTEFMKKEQKRRKYTSAHSVNDSSHVTPFDIGHGSGSKTKLLRWLIGLSIATLLVVSVAIGFFFVMPYIEKINSTKPLSPISPPASPGVPKPPSQPLAYERSILEELYNATNGSHWRVGLGWMSWQSICQWGGIRCTDNYRVKSIFLGEMDLVGTIPASIGDLEFLEKLTFDGNKLTGQLPASLGKLTNLQSFSIEGNSINGTIPEELFSLSNLSNLVLTNNKFDAWEIPSKISQLKKLQHFHAHCTNLVGTVPQELADLPNLESVWLGYNRLHGTLPAFSSPSLEDISISRNQLSGPVTFLSSLKHLQELNINNNKFSGEFTLPYDGTDNMNSLRIDNNQFTSISPDIFNASMPNLFYCSATNNSFVCPLPDWMAESCLVACY